MNDMEKVVNQVRNVEEGVNSLVIPILKDTIDDYKSTFKKMFIIIILQILALLVIITYCCFLFSRTNERYNDFLSQFEFGSEEYTYSQNLNADNGDSIINSDISIDK